MTTATSQSAYEIVGGRHVVREVVDSFYDLMVREPVYGELRALHAEDLAPMRSSLSSFLTAWLGGPRDWFEERPGKCMMSAHHGVAISQASAEQWADAMTRAVLDCVTDKSIAKKLAEALSSMAIAMAGNRAP